MISESVLGGGTLVLPFFCAYSSKGNGVIIWLILLPNLAPLSFTQTAIFNEAKNIQETQTNILKSEITIIFKGYIKFFG